MPFSIPLAIHYLAIFGIFIPMPSPEVYIIKILHYLCMPLLDCLVFSHKCIVGIPKILYLLNIGCNLGPHHQQGPD